MIKAAVISIGNEILLGKTVNTNLAYIGKKLSGMGINLISSMTVKDQKKSIIEALDLFLPKVDIIITTGGLGPTADDITKKTIADYFHKELKFKESIWNKIIKRFEKRGIILPEINKNQALVPVDFIDLENNYGTAPGLFYSNNNKLFFSLPGVPIEMKYLMDNQVLPILKSEFDVKPIFTTDIHTIGIAESAIAEELNEVEIPKGVNLAYLPQTGRVDLRVYGQDQQKNDKLINFLNDKFKDYIWGIDQSSVAEKIHTELLKTDKTLSLAESCTGGKVQEQLTRFAGSSKYLLGGIVSYSNDVKINVLKVDQNTIENEGAVSYKTALGMANGVMNLTGSDFSGSITGIAGPSGGTEEKPVGTVYICVKSKTKNDIQKYCFSGDRETVRVKSTERLLLNLLRLMKSE